MEHRLSKLRAMSEFTLTEAWRFSLGRNAGRQQAIPVRSAASLECTVNPCNSIPCDASHLGSRRVNTSGVTASGQGAKIIIYEARIPRSENGVGIGSDRETTYVAPCTLRRKRATLPGEIAAQRDTRSPVRRVPLNYERLYAGERRRIRTSFLFACIEI